MPKVGMEPIRRQQIIQAVLNLVAENGTQSITLDKVAEEAGVSKGVVTYYFDNKKKVILGAFNAFLQNYMNEINSLVEIMSEPYTARDILKIIGASSLNISDPYLEKEGIVGNTLAPLLKLTSTQRKKIMIQIYSNLTVSDDCKEVVAELYRQFYDAILKVLDFGKKKKEFNIKNTKEEAIHLMGLLEGLAIYSIIGFHGSEKEHLDVYLNYIENL